LSNLAIVIPFYDEELRIGNGQYLKDLSSQLEADFFYIDDGSRDNTRHRLISLSRITGAKVIELEANVGKGEAIRSGLIEATRSGNYDFIGYLDADGAFPASEVLRGFNMAKSIFHSMPSIDVFIASRIKLAGREIYRSAIRHYLSRIIITIIGFSTRHMPYDSQSGLKFFRNSQKFKSNIVEPFNTRWFFDLELMSRLGVQDGNCIWEEPVNFWSDIKGSKIGILSVPSILKELITVIRILGRQ
jgi:glycosyltransferase involved in cell wall biosynthesis